MTLAFNPKSMFFDRKAVIDAIGRANAKVLSKAGAFIRRTAKSSIRKRKRASRPGEPPSSHVGTLKDLIYFGFDTSTASVVIGPTPFRGRAVVPRLLELGGSSGTRKNRRRKVRKLGATGEIKIKGSKPVYVRLETPAQVDRANQINEQLYGPETLGPVHIEARPYMGPALMMELPKLPPLWANSVR
jgi:hypothetical protein